MMRPNADTQNGSKYPNMKELVRDAVGGVWRIVFAFDPESRAVLLVAGDKAGSYEQRFYKRLIAKADKRFEQRLASLIWKNDGQIAQGTA